MKVRPKNAKVSVSTTDTTFLAAELDEADDRTGRASGTLSQPETATKSWLNPKRRILPRRQRFNDG
jgi:hypothetical protein